MTERYMFQRAFHISTPLKTIHIKRSIKQHVQNQWLNQGAGLHSLLFWNFVTIVVSDFFFGKKVEGDILDDIRRCVCVENNAT